MTSIHHLCIARLGETYIGFDIQSVRSIYEVYDLLTLPLPLPNILGVFNQRGKVLSVVDSKALCMLDQEEETSTGETAAAHDTNPSGGVDTQKYYTLLHLETNGEECCFTIDSVEEVKEMDMDTFREPPAGLNPAMKMFCTGVLLEPDQPTILILDFPKMFSSLVSVGASMGSEVKHNKQ